MNTDGILIFDRLDQCIQEAYNHVSRTGKQFEAELDPEKYFTSDTLTIICTDHKAYDENKNPIANYLKRMDIAPLNYINNQDKDLHSQIELLSFYL
jgi:hypothetical protein